MAVKVFWLQTWSSGASISRKSTILNYWTAPKWKHLCWLSTWRLFRSLFFIVSLPFSIQLPERHNREKEKFLKNLFVSNFYQKTNLKQVMAQNSSCCFVSFHVFFVCSFSTRKKDWNKFLAKLHVSLRTSDLSTETLCWKEREDCSRPLWRLFYFLALCWKTIKSPFHPNAKQ